jgi:hypothetical protein
MAMDQGIPVQDMAYERLKTRLLSDKQRLEWKGN